MTAAAFQATYADWRLIKTRKTVQVVFEIPLESADAAYQALGGMPDAGTERWFGIARLKAPSPAQEAKQPRSSPDPSRDTDGAPIREKRAWIDLGAPQQAGILASDPAFWKFLNDEGLCLGVGRIWEPRIGTAGEGAAAIRHLCGVDSRADIKPGTVAEVTWLQIVNLYRAWQYEPEFV